MKHFEECKKTIEQHPGAKVVSKGAFQISPGEQPHSGLRAAYTFASTDFRNFKPGELVNSKLYVFPFGGNRMLKFRITYPKAQEAAAEPAIKALLNGFVWP